MKNKTHDKEAYEHKMIAEIKHKQAKRERWATVLSAVSALMLTLISIILTFSEAHSWVMEKCAPLMPILIGVFGIFGVIAIFLQIYNGKKADEMTADYLYYEASKKVSTALLTAIKRTDFDKTCSILQSTYGHVPEWHPIDYCQNVLVYDVHQHLRSICIRLKELIISLAPGEFNDDMVTVDIIYKYPADCDFDLPDSGISPCNCRQSSHKQKEQGTCEDWRIITSGDHTEAGNSIQGFLEAGRKTFFNHLSQEKYIFGNDKAKLNASDHYEWSQKDAEYGNRGSIVGKVIDLKNDTPETVFVEVYLTITTYGRRLVEENDSLSLEDFEKLFKETVINSYKTLIETELAQMFIRHGIRDGFINRFNGMIKYKKKNTSAGTLNPASPTTPTAPTTPTTP